MKIRTLTLVAALAAAAGSPVIARPFSAGDLVVSRVGDGTAALAATGTAVFLSEFTTGGGLIGTTSVPTSASGSNRQMTLSGTATSEGFLTLSGDGRFLTMMGYDAAVGTASLTSSASATINRVVARIDDNMVIDTTTALTDASTGASPRSVVSTNGTDLWVAGGAGGARYTTLGGTTSVQLSTTVANLRVLNIFNNQLYTSTMSGAFRGVNTIGSGVPQTSGQTTTLLNGFDPSVTSAQSAYDYFFANSTTLYVADDRTLASGGGLQKWTLSAGTWSLAATFNTNLTAGLRGLTGTVDGLGNTVLYATTADATTATAGNKLVTLTDTGSGSAFTVLATAPGNTAFRGVDFAPIPSPGALALLGAAGLLAAKRRR